MVAGRRLGERDEGGAGMSVVSGRFGRRGRRRARWGRRHMKQGGKVVGTPGRWGQLGSKFSKWV